MPSQRGSEVRLCRSLDKCAPMRTPDTCSILRALDTFNARKEARPFVFTRGAWLFSFFSSCSSFANFGHTPFTLLNNARGALPESNPVTSSSHKYRFKECMHPNIVTEHVVNALAAADPTMTRKEINKSTWQKNESVRKGVKKKRKRNCMRTCGGYVRYCIAIQQEGVPLRVAY